MENDHVLAIHLGFYRLLVVIKYQPYCTIVQGSGFLGMNDIGALTVDDEAIKDILVRLIDEY